jgi:hypothetical protein
MLVNSGQTVRTVSPGPEIGNTMAVCLAVYAISAIANRIEIVPELFAKTAKRALLFQ